MPAGIGYGMGGGFGLPPVPNQVMPSGAPDGQAISEIVQMLKGGQVSAERFVELLSLLSSSTLGSQEGPAQQPAPADPTSIAGLLGG